MAYTASRVARYAQASLARPRSSLRQGEWARIHRQRTRCTIISALYSLYLSTLAFAARYFLVKGCQI